jgi:hypothetical protein
MARDINKKDNNEERDFPGYPHYPSDEDITNPSNGHKKVNTDVEGLANSTRLSSMAAREEQNRTEDSERTDDEDEVRIVPGTEADVTEEDLILLGDKDADQDMNDDELIRGNARVDSVDNEADLDIPGADQDEGDDAMGQYDEENNYYSLGGDRHENLDEDPAGGNQDQ